MNRHDAPVSEISLPFKITKFHTALPIDLVLKSHHLSLTDGRKVAEQRREGKERKKLVEEKSMIFNISMIYLQGESK